MTLVDGLCAMARISSLASATSARPEQRAEDLLIFVELLEHEVVHQPMR
jgi:hypothetical protein